MTDSILIIDEKDNVAVALRDLAACETVAAGQTARVTVAEPISAAHKIALWQ